MTICLAALCKEDEESRAVVGADRMVTLGGFIEFEHAVPKMTATASYAVAMIAGDALVGMQLAQTVADSFAGGNPAVADIAHELAAGFGRARTERLEQQILSLRALTLQAFYGNHTTLNQNIVAMLDNQMAQYNVGLELLLAGVDPSGAHIYSVLHPGPPENLHDTIGYAAVGSGAIHALQAMIGFGHSAAAEYHETVFRVYAAKRRSEVAPGVGRETDMAVVSGSGIHWLTEDELQQLSNIYDAYEKATSAELRKQLKDFRLGEPQPRQGGEGGGNGAPASPST